MRILLIDDRAEIQEIIRHCLVSRLRCQVFSTQSFEEGLALAKAEQPDVILLAVDLLGQKQEHRAAQLRALKSAKNSPVLLLTARARLGDQQLFQELGIAAVISQPFDPSVLSEQIAAIGRQQSPQSHH